MPLTNEQVQQVVAATYDVVGRVHRIARALGAVLTIMVALMAFLYVQQHNLSEDQADTLEVDRHLEAILAELDVAVDRVDANTSSVAAYVAEIRARSAAQGGTSGEVARRLVLIDRMALLLEQLYGPLPEATTTTTGG